MMVGRNVKGPGVVERQKSLSRVILNEKRNISKQKLFQERVSLKPRSPSGLDKT